jgi:hypothetical protein
MQVSHQLDATRYAQLPVDVAEVCLDGTYTYEELSCDIARRGACSRGLEDRAFTIRQAVKQQFAQLRSLSPSTIIPTAHLGVLLVSTTAPWLQWKVDPINGLADARSPRALEFMFSTASHGRVTRL